MTRDQKIWTLDSARAFILQIRPVVAAAGWAIALGGSVLFRGESQKDLDLIFFPLSTDDVSNALLSDALKKHMHLVLDTGKVHEEWRKKGSGDWKNVSVWKDNHRGRRVDVFIFCGD